MVEYYSYESSIDIETLLKARIKKIGDDLLEWEQRTKNYEETRKKRSNQHFLEDNMDLIANKFVQWAKKKIKKKPDRKKWCIGISYKRFIRIFTNINSKFEMSWSDFKKDEEIYSGILRDEINYFFGKKQLFEITSIRDIGFINGNRRSQRSQRSRKHHDRDPKITVTVSLGRSLRWNW